MGSNWRQLAQERTAKIEHAQVLVDAAVGEGRGLNAEERLGIERDLLDVRELQHQITQIRRARERERNLLAAGPNL